jgi:hypothetical protein
LRIRRRPVGRKPPPGRPTRRVGRSSGRHGIILRSGRGRLAGRP